MLEAPMPSPGKHRSVRLRLTAVYGGLFLLSGAVLLALTYVLVRHATDGGFVTVSTGSARTPTGALGMTATSHAIELHELLVQSAIALAIMTVVSAGLGWLVAGRVLAPQQAAFEAERRFVANASHELRTPLAMMRTSLDVAVAKPVPISTEVLALDAKLREGLDQAERLVESFLVLARAQDGLIDERASVPLTAVVDGALRRRKALIAEKELDVETSLAPISVVGSGTLIARMVDNVIENAVRHNEPGGFITVRSELHGDVARLVVENGGQQVYDASVDQLARPFRRLGVERTGSVDGVGLGLSIVAAVASAHGGTLGLRARPGGGLRVEVELAGAAVAREPAGVGS
jgi:signal transduction histidine kinase